MRQILHSILFSLVLILAISVTASANNGGDDDNKTTTEQTTNDIQVYPNPAIDYIMVTDNEAVSKVWIYNILGRRVKSYKVEADAKYDIKDLPRGMYIVRLIDNSGQLVMTRRINKINP